MASLSREIAQWVVGLRYDDLPAAVVDRAKGVTLHSLASVLLGSQTPGGRQAVQLMTAEESGVSRGATIIEAGAIANPAKPVLSLRNRRRLGSFLLTRSPND